ncbi:MULTISPECIES: fimbrial protein [Providencia]|uniref:Fimbrial protein n=2 Tax=Gammaproteobacteria TaxID=1236 RepID=A0AA42JVJ2_9GAMM|nr:MULTISPECIES: fimbrial protein [Providencia]MBC8654666.1 fimbrial protein [Providencia vermicola]APC10164.1 Minor fimbrial protein PrsF precursor [Providencia rettgeri]AVL73800.1 fimbrial protein [Providencia rettgeri]EIL1984688.1 fimbrial protein [Providencia rettgeri]EIU9514892.1 fimbrial protein [Providencia rettgeri]
MLNVKMIMSAVLLMVSLPFVSNAKDYETEISIKGNLITPPPCHIDDGKDIEVDFETISVKSIQGNDQKKQVNYQIQCGDNKNNWAMYLKLNGAKSAFDLNGISTGVDNLAVKFQLADQDLELGKKYLIDPSSPGVLWAVLIRNGNNEIKTGDFVANATMVVEYE